jgi:hypothetical protein
MRVMTPNGTLTAERVRLMIIEELKDYDVGNSLRHTENSKKLDRLTYLILGTLLTAAAGLIVDVVIHSMGK